MKGDRIRIFHIADAHNRVESPVLAAQAMEGDIDLLVLNGDIPDHSGKLENFDARTIKRIFRGILNIACKGIGLSLFFKPVSI